MTDKEIIKALECCSESNSVGYCLFECPRFTSSYFGESYDVCKAGLIEETLALINRQQAEIERLEENEETVIREYRVVNTDKERILLIAAELSSKLKTAKAEAVKEFLYKLKSIPNIVVYKREIDAIAEEMGVGVDER